MTAIIYILGIVTGIALSAFAAILLKRNEVTIVRKLLQANAKIVSSKEKAEFLSPIDTETEALEQIIKENEEKGIDTKLNEL